MSEVTTSVSILVTVYKRTKFLESALASVLAQTSRDFEILLLDDSASDEVLAVANKHLHDPRHRYLRSESPLGVAGSIRKGLRECRHDIVAILNDDDEWEPTFLKRLIEPMLKDSKCVMSFSDHWIIDSNGIIDTAQSERNSATYGRTGLSVGWQRDVLDVVLGLKAVPFVMGTLFRRSSLPPDEPSDSVGGHYDFWMSALLARTGGRVHFAPERLTRYRIHPQMETAVLRRGKSLSSVAIYAAIQTWDLPSGLGSEMKFRLADSWFHCGKEYLAHGEFAAARKHFVLALKVKVYWKPLCGWLIAFLGDCSRSLLPKFRTWGLASRIVKVLSSWRRTVELGSARRLFRNYLSVICRYVFRTPGNYPFIAKLRRGYDVECADWHDLTTVWAVFCGGEYFIPHDTKQIVDVGANVGFFTLMAAVEAPVSRIVAVEAFPATAERLKANIRRWGLEDRVVVIVAAAGATQEDVFISASAETPSHSRHVVDANAAGNVLKVAGISLDALAERLGGNIDLLKVDIEGAEVSFLLASRQLSRVAEIQVEWHGLERREQLRSHLEKSGFMLVSEKSRNEVGTAQFVRQKQ